MSRRQFNQVRSCFVRISAIMTVRLSYVLLYVDNVEKKKKYRKLVKKKKEEISTNVYQSRKVKACSKRSTRIRAYVREGVRLSV